MTAPHYTTIADAHCDLVIANYVLMDTPDLRDTMAAFHRVLKPGGVAVLVFSHPCFPQERATVSEDGDEISLSLELPVLRAADMHRSAMGAFHLGVHLVSSTAVGLLEDLHGGRVCRGRF